jgi:hypothetical protein
MSSNSAANESDTSVTKVEQKQTAATIPRLEQKQANSTCDDTSEVTTWMDDKPAKEAGSKTDKVKELAKSARQWTMFGESTNPKQERYGFYKWFVDPVVWYS